MDLSKMNNSINFGIPIDKNNRFASQWSIPVNSFDDFGLQGDNFEQNDMDFARSIRQTSTPQRSFESMLERQQNQSYQRQSTSSSYCSTDSYDSIQERKIFVGGLPQKLDEKELWEYYSQWGTVIDCVVMKDHDSGKSKGYGFVTYATREMYELAMDNLPHEIRHKQVDAQPAISREEMAQLKRDEKKQKRMNSSKAKKGKRLMYEEQFDDMSLESDEQVQSNVKPQERVQDSVYKFINHAQNHSKFLDQASKSHFQMPTLSFVFDVNVKFPPPIGTPSKQSD